jgi:hypothetical protein
MRPTIENVNISEVDANPFRRLGDYPYIQRKIAALKRSINDVGLWEGVIARRSGNRVQIAFGHHRVEAARQAGLTEIAMIVRDLDDDQMLGFMGRENMEDYNADFLTMLETWEAAVLHQRDGQSDQPIDIARLLGWTQDRSMTEGRKSVSVQMNRTAEACNSAHTLIEGGYVKRGDLHDMTVNDAREILTRASANMKRLDAMGKQGGRPAAEIERAKEQVGKAIKVTADEARDGSVSKKGLRGRLDSNTYRAAQQAKVKSPLFAEFGKTIASRIEAMLNSDVNSEKLSEMIGVLDIIEAEEDYAIIARVKFALGELSDRALRWDRKLIANKVVAMTAIQGGKNDE